jgi:translation initiation factor IF-3
MKNNRDFVLTNFKIKAKEVRCIDGDENLGLILLKDAIERAFNKGLDLVQISVVDSIPVCKIVDYGKYKYDLSKKNKEAAKKQRESAIKIKEVKLRPNTDFNDLKIKARQASEFLSDGDRVKVILLFRGREVTHKNVGIDTLKKFMDFIENGKFSSDPQMNGNNITVILERK